jgi:HK97 family phage portal protein
MWDDDSPSQSSAGVRINSSNAHQVAAVFSCLRVVAETVAGLPLHVLERSAGGGKRIAKELPLYKQLHSQPNGWQTSFEWREQAVMHVGLWGDAFSELKAGQIVPLHPSRMKIERIENGNLRYKYREEKGTETTYNNEQILQIRGPSDDGVNGLSIVEECKDAIALARACELHGARFFAAGARPGFVLSTEGQLNAEAREALRSQWDRRHGGVGNSHNTAVLTGGLKPYDIPQASNTDSQFIELRRYQLEEIARLFRIPGSRLGLAPDTPEADIAFVTHCIMPWLRRFESAFTRDLIGDDDRYIVEFDVRGLLRGDAASRSAFYRAMWDIGVVSTNDIRATENLDPVEGGDVRYRPLNMGTLGENPAATDVLAQQQKGSGIDGQAVEGGLDAAATDQPPQTDAAPGEPEEPQVADVSLNGAQITGLIAILTQIPAGLLTKEGAAALIAASFPSITAAQVASILAGVREAAPPAEPAPAPVLQPEQASEARAEPGTVSEGDFVSWDSSGGRARGRIDHVMDYGTLDIPGTDFKIEASEEDPAALITVYEEVTGGWRATETQVGHKVATLTKIDPLPEPPPVEESAYGKPKRKGRRDCGTGAGGFKPGNKCAGEGSGSDGGGSGDGGGQVDAGTFSSQPNFAPADDYPAAGKGGLVGVRLHEIASEGDLSSYESMSVSSGTNYLKRLMPDEAASDLRRIVSDDSFRIKESKTVYFGVDSSFDAKISDSDEYQFTIARHSGITPERALNYAVKADRTGSGAVYEMELPAGSRTVYADVFSQPEVVSMPLSRIKIVEKGEREIDGVRVPYRKVKLIDDGTDGLSSYFDAVDRVDEKISSKQRVRAVRKKADGEV